MASEFRTSSSHAFCATLIALAVTASLLLSAGVVTAQSTTPPLIVDSSADDNIYVPEGGTRTVKVYMILAPTANVTAAVSLSSGTAHVGVTSGSSLTFTPTAYNRDNAREVVLTGTDDTITEELDSSVLRIVTTSTDSRYNNRTYDFNVRVVDNDSVAHLKGVSKYGPPVEFSEGSNEPLELIATLNRRTHQRVTFNLTTDVPNFIDNFHISKGWIDVGGTTAKITLWIKDDNLVEQDVTSMLTIQPQDPGGNALAASTNTVIIRHKDDDKVSAYIRAKWNTNANPPSLTGYKIELSRPLTFDVKVSIKATNNATFTESTLTAGSMDMDLGLANIALLEGIVIQTPNRFQRHDGSSWMMASEGIVVAGHGDALPTSFVTPRVQWSPGYRYSDHRPAFEVQEELRALGRIEAEAEGESETRRPRLRGVSVDARTQDSISISWPAVEGADSYQVRYWMKNRKSKTQHKVGVDGTSFTLPDLKSNKEYVIRVAYLMDGKVVSGKVSKPISAQTRRAR